MLQNVTQCDETPRGVPTAAATAATTPAHSDNGNGRTPPPDLTDYDSPDADLPPVQLRAIDLILLGRSDAAVARTLHISRMTVWRWKIHDVEFRRELARRRDHLWITTADRYRRLHQKAARILTRQLNDQDPQRAFRAAQTLLQMTSRFTP